MAKRKQAAAVGKARAEVKAAMEEQAAAAVNQHYAKTLYFNDLWVAFLGKMVGLVFIMSWMALQRMHQTEAGLQFVAGFEVLSIVIALATTIFIRRFFNTLLAFKVAFAFSLLQALWFGVSFSKRWMGLPQDVGDLYIDQLPIGVLYFLVCWASDRFMLRSSDQAKEAAEGMQEVLQQKAKTQ